MLKIICLNSGNYLGRGQEYVEILFDKVRRNLSDKIEFEFLCFTDDPNPYANGIQKKPLLKNLKGWWHKLYFFKKGLFNQGDRIVFLDLDTVIVGGLDEIVKYDGPFATLRDFYRPNGLGPAIILWTPTKHTEYIWTHFISRWNLGLREDYFSRLGGRGDQAILEDIRDLTTQFELDTRGTVYEKRWAENPVKNPDILQDIFPKMFRSYKVDCQINIPKGTRIVCFHGLPRPHEIKHGWMPHVWKVGGGSIIELEIVPNTSEDDFEKNIRYALTLPYEVLRDQYMTPREDSLCIVGGGPSLKRDLDKIKTMAANGSTIWALNNTFRYLCSNGIEPDAHILLDARIENIDFVPEKTDAFLIYSAQCHPRVLSKAGFVTDKIITWCPSHENILKILDEVKIRAAIVGTGTTVGMKALGLAQLFGFKDVHLFGYDSSYDDNDHHAYAQPMNDGQNLIDDIVVNDKRFKCAAWMVSQAEEFRTNIGVFVEAGMQFTVHGTGLLPYLATTMMA